MLDLFRQIIFGENIDYAYIIDFVQWHIQFVCCRETARVLVKYTVFSSTKAGKSCQLLNLLHSETMYWETYSLGNSSGNLTSLGPNLTVSV